MFEKKQVIYSATLGVCKVENIVQLSANRNRENKVAYYVLRPLFADNRAAYIPVEHHQVELRELFSKDEAYRILEDANGLKLDQEQGKKNMPLIQAAQYVLGLTSTSGT